MHLFTEAIIKIKLIKLFNDVKMSVDFTYVGDIIESILRLIIKAPSVKELPWNIFNIGKNKPEILDNFIKEIEFSTQKTSVKKFLPMQAW